MPWVGKNMLDDSQWLPYGGVENNSGTFLSQQADVM